MDFTKLAKVANSIATGKPIADSRSVESEENPLNGIDVRERIQDTKPKVLVIDDIFLKKLSTVSRERRRQLMARLSDSQRRRVLQGLKRIQDNDQEKLGYILLDDLLANVMYDPSEENINNLDYFVEHQDYLTFSDEITELINKVKEAEVYEPGLQELNDKLGKESKLSRYVAEPSPEGNDTVDDLESDEFEVPEEEDLTEEDIQTLQDSARKHVKEFLKHKDLKKVIDAEDELLADFMGKNRDYNKSSEQYWKAFHEAWEEQCENFTEFHEEINKPEYVEDAAKMALAITDDVIDDIYDAPALDGDEVIENTKESSLLNMLSEALSDYVEGDKSKLEALATQSFEVEEPANYEDSDDDSDDSDDSQDNENNSDDSEDSDDKEFEELEDSVVKLAAGILANANVNRIIDSLKSKVPSLQIYDFCTSDCGAPYAEVPEDTGTPVDVPLTREEYYALSTPMVPTVIQEELAEVDCSKPPYINSYQCEGNCLAVNGNQFYFPYTCTAQELENRLKEAETNPQMQEIIGSCTVPLKDALRVAAKYDYLPIIDSRFYKQKLSDQYWTFDSENKPTCIPDGVQETHIRRMIRGKGNIMLFDTSFELF